VSWTWRYDTEPGPDAPAPASFSSQSDAETWIGEVWRELLDAGVQAVTLVEDGRTGYTMSLESAE